MKDLPPGAELTILWERRAVKELRTFPRKAQERIIDAVEGLKRDPLAGGMLSGEWRGLRRLRVGNYRVIYGFDGERILVTVVRVGHRREVYRR